MKKKVVLPAFALLLLVPLPALAQNLSGEVVMELQNELGVEGANDDDDRNNLFFRTEVAPTLRFSENFFIDGVAVLEPVQDLDPGEDVFFDNEGIFIEELKFNYENGSWGLFAGKFNPGFGIAWDYGRGIWNEDFAEDYEITEKLGAGASYAFETKQSGTYTLNASTFFADTSFLSDSLIQDRGNVDEDEGGASNTEDLSSFVVSLDADNVYNVEGLYYKLGYRFLAEGDADKGSGSSDDEKGWEVTLGHVFKPHERVSVDVLGEVVDIEDFGGVAGDDRQYFSASAITKLDEKWNVTLGYTARNLDVSGAPDEDDFLFQASAGYDFQNGLTLETGVRSTEETGEKDTIVGGLARYGFEF